MRIVILLFFSFCLCGSAHAEYNFGKKVRVQSDALDFVASELFIDGKFVGYVYNNEPPIKFSNSYYVYASCPTDKATGKPDGYCTEWMIYDVNKRTASPIILPGLTFFSIPSFHWPYVAYVKVPQTITPEDFKNGVVKVSCVVIEWTTQKVAVQNDVMVNVGHFETDAPGSFFPPKFVQNKDALNVICSEYSGQEKGNVISTIAIPKLK